MKRKDILFARIYKVFIEKNLQMDNLQWTMDNFEILYIVHCKLSI
jgi:hypothetical protein